MGNKTIIVLILGLLVLMACSKDKSGVCFAGTGSAITQTRALENYGSIEVHGNIDIEFYPNSGKFGADITGGENLLQGCVTEVKDGVLQIRNDNKCNWLRDYRKRVLLKVYGKEIKQLDFYGGGKFTFKDTLVTNVFTFLGLECSGDVEILLNTNDAYIKLNTGTTDVQLRGRSTEMYYYNLTPGYIFGRELATERAYVAQKGYGDLYINPSQKLRGEITKTGNVYYPGNIETDVEITGSGRLLMFDK